MTKAIRVKRESAQKLWQKHESFGKGGRSFLLETQKSCQNKSRKVLAKEGAVFFWRLGLKSREKHKVVKDKIKNI